MDEPIVDILAGSARGATQVLVGHPLDTLKVRIQTNHATFDGLLSSFRTTLKVDGFSGFYKGASSPLCGCMLYSASLFLAYGRSRRLFELDRYPDSIWRQIGAGGFTGMCASFVESPVDLFKSKVQIQHGRADHLYSGSLDCARKLYREYGIRGIYQGLEATMCRNIPGSATYFGSYEMITRGLRDENTTTLPPHLVLTAGGIAGVVFWMVIYPLDVVKSVTQTQPSDPRLRQSRSMLDTAKRLQKDTTQLSEAKVKGRHHLRSASPVNYATMSSEDSSETGRALTVSPSTPGCTDVGPFVRTGNMVVIVSNSDGIIKAANWNIGPLLGYRRKQLIGQNVKVLVPRGFSKRHDSYIERYIKTKKPVVMGQTRTVMVKRKDKTLVKCLLSLSEGVDSDGTRTFIALIEEVYEKQVILDLDAQLRIVMVRGELYSLLKLRKSQALGLAKSAISNDSMDVDDEPKPMSLEKLVTEETLKRIGEWIKRNGSDQDEIDDSEPQSPRSIVHALNGTAVNANEETLAVALQIEALDPDSDTDYDSMSGEDSPRTPRGRRSSSTPGLNPGQAPHSKAIYRCVMTAVENLDVSVRVNHEGRIISVSNDFCLLFGYDAEEITGSSDLFISKLIKCDLSFFRKSGKKLRQLRQSNPHVHMDSGPHQVIAYHKDGSTFSVVCNLNSESGGVSASDITYNVRVHRMGGKKNKDRSDLIPYGEYVGCYRYGSTIGSGTFAKVCVATHRLTGEKVAIKSLSKKKYKQFKMQYPPREIELLQKLFHPYVSVLYDTVRVTEKVHLVMEFVDGEELTVPAAEMKGLPEATARKYFRQIVVAVDYCHSQGVVHRDLKLDNILVSKSGICQLIDFGLGQVINSCAIYIDFLSSSDQRELLDTFCGSPDYAAPELFRSLPYEGPLADIWSLGVCLFGMLTGRLPFKDIPALLANKYSIPTKIQPRAADLINRILQNNPSNRPSMREIFNHPWLSEGLDGPPVPLPTDWTATIDDEVVAQMADMGFDPQSLKADLRGMVRNPMTTCYYLKIKAQRRKGHKYSMCQRLRDHFNYDLKTASLISSATQLTESNSESEEDDDDKKKCAVQ